MELMLFIHLSDVVETSLLQLLHVPLVLANNLRWNDTLEGIVGLEGELLFDCARVD